MMRELDNLGLPLSEIRDLTTTDTHGSSCRPSCDLAQQRSSASGELLSGFRSGSPCGSLPLGDIGKRTFVRISTALSHRKLLRSTYCDNQDDVGLFKLSSSIMVVRDCTPSSVKCPGVRGFSGLKQQYEAERYACALSLHHSLKLFGLLESEVLKIYHQREATRLVSDGSTVKADHTFGSYERTG